MINSNYLDAILERLQGEGCNKFASLYEADINDNTKEVVFHFTCTMSNESFKTLQKCIEDCKNENKHKELQPMLISDFGNPVECLEANKDIYTK